MSDDSDYEISTNEITCPYCKSKIEDEYYLYKVDEIVTCDCGKKFRIGEIDHELTFWTYKIEEQEKEAMK